jgi:uncharacterized protein YyaL (SSP411 family)
MFGDADAVELLAREFVAVVVDRDERPEVESLHAAALGLPLAGVSHPVVVVLAPDGRPYFGAAGVERDDRDGRQGLGSVLRAAAALLRREPAAVEDRAARAVAALREAERPAPARDRLGETVVDSAVRGLSESFDGVHGGFGLPPKRPPHAALMFLLEQHEAGRRHALERVRRTLDAMAGGALRDHVGGGFHRESADAAWRRPRFEKALADNALLLRTYALAHAATGAPLYRRVAEEIADWARRDLSDPSGAFRASLDAESAGEDGALYRWSREQIAAELGEAKTAELLTSYRLDAEGLVLPLDPAAPRAAAIDALLAARARRPRPAVDERVFAGANGLMIGALAVSGRLLGRPDHVEAARAAASAVLGRLASVSVPDHPSSLVTPAPGAAGFRPSSPPSLKRWLRGDESGGAGLLEDHAYVSQGLLDLYDADGDRRWLDQARSVVDTALGRFLDVSGGGFFETDASHGPLLGRVRNGYDGDRPSGAGVMAGVLLRLGAATGEPRYAGLARRTVEGFLGELQRTPRGMESLASAAHALLGAGAGTALPVAAVETRAAAARQTRGPVTVDVSGTAGARGLERVQVGLAIDPGWRVVGRRPSGSGLVGLSVSVPGVGVRASPAYPPAGDYTGRVVVDVPLAWARGGGDAGAVRVRVVFQACDDAGCRAPETLLLGVAPAAAR